VAIGSLDFEGTPSTISGWGPNIALLAPGEKIYSLYSKDSKWPGGAGERERLYYAASGTSFSAPMVSATASLLLAQRPQLNNIQLEDILLNAAKDMGKEGWDDKTGAGKLNASVALQEQRDHLTTVAINKIRINEEKGKVVSVDVFATARGNVDSLIVELGEGKQPKAWTKIAGPVTKAAHDNWIVRIESGALQGNRDWVIRLSMQDQEGNVKTAQAALTLK
jgi:subtilisin family serine protease